MPRDRKLSTALKRHQGVDNRKEQQKRLQKTAEKRKRRSAAAEVEDEADDGGVLLNASAGDAEVQRVTDALGQLQKLLGGELNAEDDEDWEEIESDGGEEVQDFDIAKLDESSSDEEIEAEDKEDINGVEVEEVEDEEDEDEDEDDAENIEEDDDNESIALSDLSDQSDEQDIVPHQRLTINNTAALTRALKSFSLPYSQLTFSEYQSITTAEPVSIPDINDDLNRELAFYEQALGAAKQGRQQLKKEGVAFTRPTDYFAEMVKTDEHMGKIKSKLIEEAANKRASADARKQRDLKKFGKAVQNEKLKERAKDKRDTLEKVKMLKRKRQSEGIAEDREANMFDVALDNPETSERRPKRSKDEKSGGLNKRTRKDAKFGFGGKKRFAKSGDAQSAGDVSSFSHKKMKAGTKKAPAKRLGKSKRTQRR